MQRTALTDDSSLSAAALGFFLRMITVSQSQPPLRFMVCLLLLLEKTVICVIKLVVVVLCASVFVWRG